METEDKILVCSSDHRLLLGCNFCPECGKKLGAMSAEELLNSKIPSFGLTEGLTVEVYNKLNSDWKFARFASLDFSKTFRENLLMLLEGANLENDYFIAFPPVDGKSMSANSTHAQSWNQIRNVHFYFNQAMDYLGKIYVGALEEVFDEKITPSNQLEDWIMEMLSESKDLPSSIEGFGLGLYLRDKTRFRQRYLFDVDSLYFQISSTFTTLGDNTEIKLAAEFTFLWTTFFQSSSTNCRYRNRLDDDFALLKKVSQELSKNLTQATAKFSPILAAHNFYLKSEAEAKEFENMSLSLFKWKFENLYQPMAEINGCQIYRYAGGTFPTFADQELHRRTRNVRLALETLAKSSEPPQQIYPETVCSLILN